MGAPVRDYQQHDVSLIADQKAITAFGQIVLRIEIVNGSVSVARCIHTMEDDLDRREYAQCCTFAPGTNGLVLCGMPGRAHVACAVLSSFGSLLIMQLAISSSCC